jgi:two-component system, OmpR family, sensor histidine kinase MprB
MDFTTEELRWFSRSLNEISTGGGPIENLEFDLRIGGDVEAAAAMERAITNLLDNAAKWSPPEGRVTVRVSAGVLTVDDQSPGIDAEDLPHVFERFYRARESRGMPGSGLGLSIVRQVVARHAGTVAVHNREGGGTRFTVVLPGSSSPHGASSERRGRSGS